MPSVNKWNSYFGYTLSINGKHLNHTEINRRGSRGILAIRIVFYIILYSVDRENSNKI